MLEEIALAIIGLSVIVLLWSLVSTNKGSSKSKKQMTRGKPSGVKESMPAPTAGMGSDDEEMGDIKESSWVEAEESPPAEDMHPAALEMATRPSAGRSEPIMHEGPRGDMKAAVGPRKRTQTVESMMIQRKASLIYWERMCLEEEFDLTVALHKPEFKVSVPEGASHHESETIYQLPTTGHVRVVPVCSGCNISPAFRDIKVAELDAETKAEFKVLPLKDGEFDLNVEFQVVNADGQIVPLGVESTKVTIQKKPIELNLGALNISVSRRVPAFFSVVGSLFGLVSFVLARFGVNVNEEIYAWSTTISTGVAGAVMILLAMMLLIKGLRPLMNEIDISFK